MELEISGCKHSSQYLCDKFPIVGMGNMVHRALTRSGGETVPVLACGQ